MQIHTVEPTRLSSGVWDATKQKGEGDIHKAYSGDAISSGKIRGVITVDGKPYTVTGLSRNEARLWPLLTVAEWGEKPTLTYGDLTTRPEFSYEGIKVKRGKDHFVMGARSGEIIVRGAEPAAAPPTTAPEEDESNDDEQQPATNAEIDAAEPADGNFGLEAGDDDDDDGPTCGHCHRTLPCLCDHAEMERKAQLIAAHERWKEEWKITAA